MQVLAVPTSQPDESLRESGVFRAKGRIPALTYLYGGAALCRSAQPLCGLLRRRSPADDALVCAALCRGGSGHVVDARTQLSAMANSLRGGGYEAIPPDARITLTFHNIANIHVVRAALGATLEACRAHPRCGADGHVPGPCCEAW